MSFTILKAAHQMVRTEANKVRLSAAAHPYVGHLQWCRGFFDGAWTCCWSLDLPDQERLDRIGAENEIRFLSFNYAERRNER